MTDPYSPPPNPYSQQPYSPPTGLTPHPQATTTLVLGVVGLVACALAAPFAWVIGSKARKEVRENPGRYQEDSALKVGWILGIVGTVILVLSLVLIVVIFTFAALAGDSLNEEYDTGYCSSSDTYCNDEAPGPPEFGEGESA